MSVVRSPDSEPEYIVLFLVTPGDVRLKCFPSLVPHQQRISRSPTLLADAETSKRTCFARMKSSDPVPFFDEVKLIRYI